MMSILGLRYVRKAFELLLNLKERLRVFVMDDKISFGTFVLNDKVQIRNIPIEKKQNF